MYYGKKLTRETWKYKLEDLNKFKQKKKRKKEKRKEKNRKWLIQRLDFFFII